MRVRCELIRFLESTEVIILLIIAIILVNLYGFAGREISSFMKEFNKAFPNTTGPIIMGIVSFTTAYIILKIQEVIKKRKFIKSLYDEIKANISRVNFTINSYHDHDHTIFDIPFLYKSAYDLCRSSGELISLSSNLREKLERVYQLIDAHNRQRAILETSVIPRNRGFLIRSQEIINESQFILKELINQFCYLPQKKEAKASSYATPRSVQKKKFF